MQSCLSILVLWLLIASCTYLVMQQAAS